ncbi:MAG: MgtC/SapB family protein [bacterium]
MEMGVEAWMVGRALLAGVLGALVGWEREAHGREAGVRTYAAVTMGSCIFGLVSAHVAGADPTRISAQVVTGIGFLCAGVIVREQGRITGLTTAATIWAMSAVGLAIAYDLYILGVVTALIMYGLLSVHHLISPTRTKKTKDEDKNLP